MRQVLRVPIRIVGEKRKLCALTGHLFGCPSNSLPPGNSNFKKISMSCLILGNLRKTLFGRRYWGVAVNGGAVLVVATTVWWVHNLHACFMHPSFGALFQYSTQIINN